ncbi:MAG: YkgJ family cysteine cluster protein [Candidatus Methylacidiphilales bacterium]|nr:YkgJ family cysteine cluster protein [Candidatus Methylacidiphilales bacterium]
MNALLCDLRALFSQTDQATEAFARASGITCPPGCGACCHSPEVEASELEMLPMADHLVRTGKAEATLRQLHEHPDATTCVFFEPVAGSDTAGRCGQYAQRPLLCRLFGFAGRRDQNGTPQFTACRIHQQTCPTAVSESTLRVARGELRPPLYTEATDALWALHPEIGFDRFPINQALRRALERLLTRMSYENP